MIGISEVITDGSTVFCSKCFSYLKMHLYSAGGTGLCCLSRCLSHLPFVWHLNFLLHQIWNRSLLPFLCFLSFAQRWDPTVLSCPEVLKQTRLLLRGNYDFTAFWCCVRQCPAVLAKAQTLVRDESNPADVCEVRALLQQSVLLFNTVWMGMFSHA